MTDVLAHRGPDGRGIHRDVTEEGGVALGHRRLSIIDLAGGKQPLCNEEATAWLTFNGEIYNYRELRTELKAQGHRFRTDSDSEVIVHLYEQYGTGCVQRLRGMFAFAIWDQRRRRLFLARDRLGQKPLVYRCEQGRLLFASEIKALLQVPDVPREIDHVALDQYLTYGYVPHPRTIFEGICKLPPAHYGVFDQSGFTTQRYWAVDVQSESEETPSKLREQLREELSTAVRLRMRSDVPLGAFLSGGIDSTAIVGLMRESSSHVNTYTASFNNSKYDESRYAHIAADHLGTDHHQLCVEPDGLGILPKLIWQFDEPFADSSAIPTYFVSQATRQHVTVALTGDGGDELFAGYPRYRTVEQLSRFDRLPAGLRRLAATRLWRYLPAGAQGSVLRRLRHRMEILREPPEERYRHWVSIFSPTQRAALHHPEQLRELRGSDGAEFVAGLMRAATGRSAGTRARLTDLGTYLPGDLLAKVDVTSMACGLECRSPFLDHHVVELACSLSFRLLCEGQGEKPFLTSALADKIPPSLRSRGKMGFCVPLDQWFRGDSLPFIRETLLSGDAFVASYFRRSAIERLLAEHVSGDWNHGDRIWSLLFLERWHQMYIQSAPPVTPPAADVTARRASTAADSAPSPAPIASSVPG